MLFLKKNNLFIDEADQIIFLYTLFFTYINLFMHNFGFYYFYVHGPGADIDNNFVGP